MSQKQTLREAPDIAPAEETACGFEVPRLPKLPPVPSEAEFAKMGRAERLLALAAFLEALPEENFDMHDYALKRKTTRTEREFGPETELYIEKAPPKDKLEETITCGTAACLAGWTTIAFPVKVKNSTYIQINGRGNLQEKRVTDYFGTARDALMLTEDEAGALFTNWKYNTRRHAIRRLKHLANTGRVIR